MDCFPLLLFLFSVTFLRAALQLLFFYLSLLLFCSAINELKKATKRVKRKLAFVRKLTKLLEQAQKEQKKLPFPGLFVCEACEQV
ncbi:hypothetical protein TYRP_019893 [Tyrophagus putrescentiae]|nr:hypothetical protein TYRP_019893 [Tyrophagus putrescentiae]